MKAGQMLRRITQEDFGFIKFQATRLWKNLVASGFNQYIEFEDVVGELGIVYAKCLQKYPEKEGREFNAVFMTAAVNWLRNWKRDKHREMSLEAGKPGPAPSFDPDPAEFRKLYMAQKANGRWMYSIKALAKHYGVSRDTVRRYIERRDLQRRELEREAA